MKIAKRSEKGESKNRPVATNFQFLKILATLGQLLVGACLPQTLLGTSAANVNLSGQSPSVLLTQDRSVTQKPHWGFHCSVSAPQTRILSAYYIYNVLSRLCKITIINMPVILAIISVTGNVHHTAFKPIK